MKKVTAYADKDGVLHSSVAACEKADNEYDKRHTLASQVNEVMLPLSEFEVRKLRFKNALGNGDWIQHYPNEVAQVVQEMVAMTMSLFPDSVKRLEKLEVRHGVKGYISELEFYTQRLRENDREIQPLTQAVYILGRIREDGREFNQPYFAVCDEKDITGKCLYSTVSV